MPNIFFFFPHNPYPPCSGAHRRCLDTLKALSDIGCKITFLSSTISSETEWNTSSIDFLKRNYVEEVLIFSPTKRETIAELFLEKYYRFSKQTPPVDTRLNAPDEMCKWFEAQFDRLQPKIIFMNYVIWDRLIRNDKYKSITKIIDTYDLVALNKVMERSINKKLKLPLASTQSVDETILDENFSARFSSRVCKREFSIFDHYHYSIAITAQESELIKNSTSKTTVECIPVCVKPNYLNNEYQSSGVFPMGPNIFNVQGYLYFLRKVLPLIKQVDHTFSLNITGAGCKKIYPSEGINLLGFVPNLSELYAQTKFAICPVITGTGQQIKIVEAMAHGIPVIATKFSGERSPIVHNENGFIANNAKEFSEYVLKLSNNKDLCRHLGSKARETVSSKFSDEILRNKLSSLIY